MLKKCLTLFQGDVHGATAIEYALISGGIALAIIGAVTAVGQNVTALFTSVANGFH